MASLSVESSSASQDYLILILNPSRPRPLPAQEWHRRLSGHITRSFVSGQLQGSPYLSSVLAFQVHAATPGFHVVRSDPNSGIHAYAEALYHGATYPPQTKLAAEL